MAGIEELNFRARYVLPERFRSGGNEKRIVLAPDGEQRGLRFAEIFLEFRIQLHVRCIIQKQIELKLYVPWALQQSPVQRVGFRRNGLWIRYAVGVLPARSL